LAPFILVAV